MIDDMLTDVNISKANVFGTEIAGAELTLTGKDTNGNEVTFSAEDVTLGDGAELRNSGAVLTWISGTSSTAINNLPNGTYTLHEVAAPEGYEVTTDIIFTIENGEVIGTAVSGNTVTMVDTMTGDVEISKQNVFSQEVKGAELTLTGKDADGNDIVFDVANVILGTDAQLTSESGTRLTWISGTSSTFVRSLPNGTYTLHEEAAPNGYRVATDITFTIENGKVIGGSEVTGNTVTMIDEMITADAKISKQNTLGEEIKGATLTLTGKDADGNTIIFNNEVELGENAQLITANGSEIKWVSGTTPTFVKNLINGTYTLHEEAAPSGYKVTTDITFTVENGEIKGGSEVSSNSVTMIDDMYMTDVKISKQNILSEEIKGATLTLTGKDVNGNEITFDNEVELGEGAELITSDGNEIKWISGTTPTFVKNLVDGTYVLHEDAAPDGYEVATDITFTIENGEVKGGTQVEGSTVTMIDNAKIVPVIDTDVEICKKNTIGEELAGATLTLTGTDENGNAITFDAEIELGNGAKLIKGEGTEITWVSGTTPTFIRNLANGTYTLHEVAAPNGYAVTTDIRFTVKDGEVSGTIGVSGTTVTMIDEILQTEKGIKFSKQDVNGSELKGAKLTLTGSDVNGNTIIFDESMIEFILGTDAELVAGSGRSLTWLSGTTPTFIVNLPDGTYVLREEAAPDGYFKASNITFTIVDGKVFDKDGNELEKILMIDEAKSDTATNTSGSSTGGSANRIVGSSTGSSSSSSSGTSRNSTSSGSSSNNTVSGDSPTTGVKDVSLPVLLLTLAIATAFRSRRKDEDE